MITPFKFCFVWLDSPMAPDRTPLMTFKQFEPTAKTNMREVLPVCQSKFDYVGWNHLRTYCSINVKL